MKRGLYPVHILKNLNIVPLIGRNIIGKHNMLTNIRTEPPWFLNEHHVGVEELEDIQWMENDVLEDNVRESFEQLQILDQIIIGRLESLKGSLLSNMKCTIKTSSPCGQPRVEMEDQKEISDMTNRSNFSTALLLSTDLYNEAHGSQFGVSSVQPAPPPMANILEGQTVST
uniref:Uncharacterized protein n=1 Tax=Sphaerodactylus townsendi TaxID=933632 RepID=A0ACB8FQH4_9SAUR